MCPGGGDIRLCQTPIPFLGGDPIHAAKTCLITGANGLLGGALQTVLAESFRVTARGHSQLDITNRAAVEAVLYETEPEVIVNGAALADVDRCQREPEAAMAVNRDGPRNLAAAAAKAGIFIVHFSTDYVFSGDARNPYRESEGTGPLSVYGESKLAGEKAVASETSHHLIIRTAWLFGPGRPTLVDNVADQLLRGERVEIVADQVSSPTYSLSLARATARLMEQGETGLFHYVGRGSCSRYDMSIFIAEWLVSRGFKATVADVTPLTSSELDWTAPRPSYSSLSVERFEEADGKKIPMWQEMLSDYLESRIKDWSR
ncbi:dTDP-4-dehydrorhamnose reductase [candidate division KSB1 bacterium]